MIAPRLHAMIIASASGNACLIERVAQKDGWAGMQRVGYLVAQEEISPSTGQHHYQVYCQMKRKCRWQAVAKVFNLPKGSYHAEVARGTWEDNRKYCSKEESRAPGTFPLILGEPVTQGQRTDLTQLTNMVSSGASMQQIAQAMPKEYLKYHRGVQALQAALAKPRDATCPNVVWVIWGSTGTGKTTKAHRELRSRFDERYYVKETMTTWWDGYQGEPGVLIDDYDGNWPISYLLTILHEHPEQTQVKGAFTKLRAKFFVITSNKHPSEWYLNADLAHRAALLRRITRIVAMDVKEEDMNSNSNGRDIIEILDSDSE